jgi:hypothetical protein
MSSFYLLDRPPAAPTETTDVDHRKSQDETGMAQTAPKHR